MKFSKTFDCKNYFGNLIEKPALIKKSVAESLSDLPA